MIKHSYKNESEWLEGRKLGLGGSDASSIIGMNPWRNNQKLFDIKTGLAQSDDISNVDCVKYGKDAEAPLRELFALDHPQYIVEHDPWAIYANDANPFLLGSFDGILTDKETGERSILEIKTTNILQSGQREKWNDQIPQNYFIQVLHYLIVSGFSKAIVCAQLKSEWGGEVRKTTRHYTINRDDYLEDIDYLLKAEIKFWQNNILPGVRPSLILPNI